MSVVFPERSSVSSWLPEQFSSPRTIQLSSEREDKTQSLQSRTVSIEPGMEIPPSCMGSGSVRDSSVPLPEQSSFASIAASDKSSVVSWLSEQSRAVSLVKFPMPVRSAISMPDSGRSVTSPHSVLGQGAVSVCVCILLEIGSKRLVRKILLGQSNLSGCGGRPIGCKHSQRHTADRHQPCQQNTETAA